MIQSEQENEIFCGGVYRFSKWTHEIAEITRDHEYFGKNAELLRRFFNHKKLNSIFVARHQLGYYP